MTLRALDALFNFVLIAALAFALAVWQVAAQIEDAAADCGPARYDTMARANPSGHGWGHACMDRD